MGPTTPTMTRRATAALLVLVFGLALSAPAVQAHGPGARYEAVGTATTATGQVFDAFVVFSGQQTDNTGAFYVEITEPTTGLPVHFAEFEVVEDVLPVTVDGCWFISSEYSLVAKLDPTVLQLHGEKRVCGDDGMQHNFFQGTYLGGLYVLDLESHGVY